MGLVRTSMEFAAPRLDLPESLKSKIATALKLAILTNIRDQRQADGSPLKPNPQRYADYKVRTGQTHQGRVMSLVAAEHRFVRPELWSAEWEGEGIACRLTIEPLLDEDTMAIVIEVQERGYVGWFEPRPEAIQAALQLVRDWIRESIRQAVARGMVG
jgi:hypothetical protein